MESFDKLEAKVSQLVDEFDKVQSERRKLESECEKLRERVKALEEDVKRLSDENLRLEKIHTSNNDMALKRITKLVDKIDQFQTELKIS